MRGRKLIIISLAANAILAVCWFLSARQASIRIASVESFLGGTNAPGDKTRVIVRRQFFSWSELESDDYNIYIKNLRDIQCPEQTIRDIIIADVNALYARRRALEVVTPEQQWWRIEPDTNVLLAAGIKLRELDAERRDLLTTLLGPGWEGGDLVSLPRPSRTPIPLDGPVLGTLSDEVKRSVETLSADTEDKIQDYISAQAKANLAVSPVEIEKLRQHGRQEIAKLLSPEQMEEFLLRYSPNAQALRTDLAQLEHFGASSNEIRAMFRALDPINSQIALLDETTAQGASTRDLLLAQAEGALKLALGPKRYEEYRRLHDEAYRNAMTKATEDGSPQKAGALYEIGQATAQEVERIRQDSALTDQQRAIAIKEAELKQLKAESQALGHELPPEPPKPPKPVPAKTHVVANGEGLNRLAQLYGVQPNELRAANPNVNFDKLKPGDKVSVPLHLLYPIPPPSADN